jgi:hypothetical protein
MTRIAPFNSQSFIASYYQGALKSDCGLGSLHRELQKCLALCSISTRAQKRALMDRRKFINTSLAAGGSLTLRGKHFGFGRVPAEALLGAAVPEANVSFLKDFFWGTATAAFQVEGAWMAKANRSGTASRIPRAGFAGERRLTSPVMTTIASRKTSGL